MYAYSSTASDTDGNELYYWFDWGDNTNSGWIGPYTSGVICEVQHNWTSEGNYNIKVKVKDEYHCESEWSDSLEISMPKSKIFNEIPRILIWLFERFPLLQPFFNFLFL